MDAAGDTSPFKADTSASGVTAEQLEASINERATDLVIEQILLFQDSF